MKKLITKLFTPRTVVLLVLLVEIALIAVVLIYFLDIFSHFYSLLRILAIPIVIILFNSKTNASYKISWLLLIALLPLFGSSCYLLFANKKFSKREKRKLKPTRDALKRANNSAASNNALIHIDKHEDADAYFFGKYLDKYSLNGIFANTKVTYYAWGEEVWPVMLEELEKAKHYIFMEYFIIQEGKMWDPMVEILIRKAKEGLDVRLMYDDVGCLSTLPHNYYKMMRENGIKCVPVNRIRAFFDVRMNNRDHRKITVIDGHTGFTGGVNLADEYINQKLRFGLWKDNAIMLKGDGVFGLTSLFLSHWCTYKPYKETIEDFSPYMPRTYMGETNEDYTAKGYVAPYGSLPFTNETVGENVYISLLMKAKKYVYITTPYLIIDDLLLNALKLTAKGGVKIRLLTPHIPDKPTVFDLTRSFYKDLISAGVEVYEYTPGFVHAKTFLVDGEMATVGTINLDYRSLFLHLENGCFLYKTDCIKDIEKDMIDTFAASTQITEDMLKKSPAYKRLWRSILKLFSSSL